MFKFPFSLIKPSAVSRQCLNFQSSRYLSVFNYRLHYQSQSDHKVSFDWNVCQNFQDICYYFEKNYVEKYIIDQNKNSQSITTKNTFTLKDIFLYQDHLELLDRTGLFIGTFDAKNEEHCALLALLLDNLNKDLQYIFYNRTIQLNTRGLLLNKAVENILTIIGGVLGKMNELGSTRKSDLKDQIGKLLINHNLIAEISSNSIQSCQKYLDVVHNLNLLNDKSFYKDFLNTFVLLGSQKTLNMRNEIVKSEKIKDNKIVTKLSEHIFNNIDQIETFDELYSTLSLLKQEGSSQRVINYPKYVEAIYQQFIKITEKADIGTIIRRNHSIFKTFQIIDLTSPPKFSKIMACFKSYSEKFLQIEHFSSLLDGVVDEFIGIFKTMYQKFLTADPSFNREVLSIFSKYIIALKESERIELRRLLKIIELLQSLKRLDSELVSQAYEDIYEIFLSRSFNKVLQEMEGGIKELNLLSNRLARILPEVYPEEKWYKINVENLSYENQILAISCLHPLVNIPQEFFVFSEEKAAALENEPLYYVKLLRFEKEAMDEKFQSYLKTFSKTHLKKGIRKYPLDLQLDLMKELISVKTEQSTAPDGKLLSLTKHIVKQAFESLNSKETTTSFLVKPEDLFFVMHKIDMFRNQEFYENTRQYVKENLEGIAPLAMARLFQYFSESGNLTETDLSFFQDYFIKRLRSLGADEFYAISVAVRNVRLKPQFYHEFTELAKNRSSNPEYLSMICEFVYHELKSKNHRSVFLDRYVSRMKVAMEADPSSVTFYDLDRMIPYIMKFKEVDWLLKIYLKKLDIFLQQPKVHHLCQVYCNFTRISDDKVIIEKLERIIKTQKDSFSSFEVTRILSSLTQRYEHNANIELLDSLLDKTMEEGFFAKKASDSGNAEIISKNVDIGILSIVFLQHCLILRDSSLPFLRNTLKLIKAIIEEKEGGLNTSSYSDNKYNMKHNILDIHVNQILQGILILKNVKNVDFQSEFEDLTPKLENLWSSFAANRNTFQNKSYFQAEVWYFLKKLLPNLEKEIPIPPFSGDFYWKTEQLLVECHGSHHYIYNDKVLRFNEKRRTQVLEALGYKVAIIPIHEWRSTPRVKRLEYLKNKIQAVGVECNNLNDEVESESE